MFRRFTKKRAIVALSVVAALAIAGAAVAYFSSSGSGTGKASVGTAKDFSVGVTDATGTLYPDNGASSQSLPYTITNGASFSQKLTSTSVSVPSLNGDVTSGGSEVPGCLVSWFHVTDTPPAYGTIAPGDHVSGSVKVTMDDSTASQDSCKSASPDIKVSAN